jgi:uncharacterized protein (DUF1330 family)
MAAYIVSVCEITKMTPGLKEYVEKSANLIHKFGGRYVVRGKPVENSEGNKLDGKTVIIVEFPTMDKLTAYMKGDEYQKGVRHLREGTGVYDIAVFESPPPGKA